MLFILVADTFRNGISTTTQTYKKAQTVNETLTAKNQRKTESVDQTEGLHESWDWYNKCYMRERNQGEAVVVHHLLLGWVERDS